MMNKCHSEAMWMKSYCTVIVLRSLYQLAGITPRILSIQFQEVPSFASPYLPDHGLSQVLAADFELVDPNLHCMPRGRVEIYRMARVYCSTACVPVFPEPSKEKQQNMFVVHDDFSCHNHNRMAGQIRYRWATDQPI
ncbi:hypothetical protein Y032_0040g220 [Ancylostoma ceylanicum]|uniref:Uncharacterized protein n=1 Tax=Ancylostoma ceylanicum TaxID=53326 RepID=A0A016UGK3_9BILA|nr:hypothetical protein Y032_0040g220 [Ancylostoma ceylanicum]